MNGGDSARGSASAAPSKDVPDQTFLSQLTPFTYTFQNSLSSIMRNSDITKHPDWTEGDVTLISSDNVSFEARSEVLISNRYATLCLCLTTFVRRGKTILSQD